MTRLRIIQELSETKKLTAANVQTLQAATTDHEFLQQLISIYERKAVNYMGACKLSIMQKLSKNNAVNAEFLEDVAVQEISDCAYSVALEEDKLSLLFSLALLLRKNSPDLAVSLGMSTTTNAGNNNPDEYCHVKNQIATVFARFYARYRLYVETPKAEFMTLCANVEQADPILFPLGLLQSFNGQTALAAMIAQRVLAQATEGADLNALWCNQMAEVIRTNQAAVYSYLAPMVLYVCVSLRTTVISEEYRNRFYAHLSQDTLVQQFVGGVCTGYVHTMCNSQNVLQAYAENQSLNAEIKQLCMPMLPVLGVKVVFTDDFLTARKNQIEENLQKIRTNKSTIEESASNTLAERRRVANQQLATIADNLGSLDSRVEAAKNKSLQNVDQWRSDFKPNWTVSTMAGPQTNEHRAAYGSLSGPRFQF